MVALEINLNQAGQRLDKFLGKYLPGAPAGFFYKMLRKKNITLNGRKAEGKEILQRRDQVTLWLADETILKFGGYLPERDGAVKRIPTVETFSQTGKNLVLTEKTYPQADNPKVLTEKTYPQADTPQALTGEVSPQAKGSFNPAEKATILADGSKKSSMEKSVREHIYHRGSVNREILYSQAYKQLHGVKVLYEDAHVLIIDKPAGVLTQQAKVGDLSLNEWMIGYLLDTGGINARELRLFKPSVCNRLDRNTSGLVLCGKSLPGSQALSELIRSRAVRKFYRTICVGAMETADFGTAIEIQGYLQKDSRTNQVTILQQEPPRREEVFHCEEVLSRKDAPYQKNTFHQKKTSHQKKAGEYIRTSYYPIEQLCIPTIFPGGRKPASLRQEPCSLTELEVELITGKTHQIRAHLASVGHPLVGDSKYGNVSVNRLFRQRFGLRWQLLHACRLQFPVLDGVLAPLSGKSIQAPLPEQYEAILRELKRGRKI